eukprot:2399956-Pleurochrysis_carterae.AAC.1
MLHQAPAELHVLHVSEVSAHSQRQQGSMYTHQAPGEKGLLTQPVAAKPPRNSVLRPHPPQRFELPERLHPPYLPTASPSPIPPTALHKDTLLVANESVELLCARQMGRRAVLLSTSQLRLCAPKFVLCQTQLTTLPLQCKEAVIDILLRSRCTRLRLPRFHRRILVHRGCLLHTALERLTRRHTIV